MSSVISSFSLKDSVADFLCCISSSSALSLIALLDSPSSPPSSRHLQSILATAVSPTFSKPNATLFLFIHLFPPSSSLSYLFPVSYYHHHHHLLSPPKINIYPSLPSRTQLPSYISLQSSLLPPLFLTTKNGIFTRPSQFSLYLTRHSFLLVSFP